AGFQVTTKAVAADTNVAITASSGGGSAQGTLKVTAARLLGLAFTPVTVKQSTSKVTSLKVSLTGLAAAGGASVALSSSNPSVVPVPASVLVPAGANSVTVSITTGPVASSTTVTVSGTYLGTTKSA